MVYNLAISLRAETDYKIAIEYFTSQSPGLGKRFGLQLFQVFEKLKINPQYYGYISTSNNKMLRDVIVNGFPFIVLFRIEEEIVTVVSVHNTNRKPIV